MGTAGSAVVFAGLTVVIALVGLAVVNIPMLTKMGLAAAGTVAIAVLIALTLIPALLGFAGEGAGAQGYAHGPKRRPTADKPNMGTRWARFVVRRPVAVRAAGVVASAIAVPAASWSWGCRTTARSRSAPRSARRTTCCRTASARASTAR